MDTPDISRRTVLLQGGATWAVLAFLHSPLFAQTLASQAGEETIAWLDQPPANPSGGVVENLQP